MVEVSEKMAQKIILVPVDELIPYARNARVHSERQVEQIANSITEFGFTNPVLTDGKRGVIAGHGRLMAAKKLGIKTVPVIELSHLSEVQKRAYILADNKLALNAGWDDELLKMELSELNDADFNLALTGMDDSVLTEFEKTDSSERQEPTKVVEGAKEFSEEEFSNFDHSCPKCGFEFNER